MGNQESNVRTVLVIGENPEEMMAKYDKNKVMKPYIKYRYLDADNIKKTAVKMLSDLVKNADKLNLTEFEKDHFKKQLQSVENMTSFEYYRTLTNGMYYDENGNALTTENPDGKFNGFNMGGNFSYPLITKDGEKETYQCHASEVLWDRVNMKAEAVNYFNSLWELVIDKRKPNDEFETKIYNEWKHRGAYLANFKTKDELIRHNCAYWTFAVLNNDGWFSMDDGGGEKDWIENFMNRFIRPLNDELLTIYEFG